jgi:hypothetical protein
VLTKELRLKTRSQYVNYGTFCPADFIGRELTTQLNLLLLILLTISTISEILGAPVLPLAKQSLSSRRNLVRMSAIHVRRDKAALSSGCKPHPAIRSSRKQPEQAWR